ncbi:MAG TPA: endopeptidase La [Armatimonadota bacterium]|nr:endopeptidase La [Armatimonadota bacterium]
MTQLDEALQCIEGKNRIQRVPTTLPVLPMRDMVIYPYIIQPLCVGREPSRQALEAAMNEERHILLLTQRDASIESPTTDDLYTVGTVAECLQMVRLPDDTIRITVEGIARVKVKQFLQEEPYFEVIGDVIVEDEEFGLEATALIRTVLQQFEHCIQLGNRIPVEALENVRNVNEPGRLADMLSSYLNLTVSQRQAILETFPTIARLELLAGYLSTEIEILEIEQRIQAKVKKELEDSQRDYYLRERMKAIQEELGERDERSSDIDELREKVDAAEMPEAVADKALKEIDRLERMPPSSPEVTVTRTYLDWLMAMPWNVRSEDNLNLDEAEDSLNADHYGLAKAKDRILEYLAVRKLNPQIHGPILCFVGPPGVGKTSIGRSIAKALGREFVRISLGGVHDEGEIRGHRRTYVGALPGRIVQGMKTAGKKNPVFMMDEIDKIGQDFRGDPASALLEVLDPEQNGTFSDHYLEVPLDLSEVMFITTANLLDPIPDALRDRMEVIEFPGYTEDEKLKIAELFLVEKQRSEHGLTNKNIQFTPEALLEIIRHYTREAGVRNLEREIGAVCRKVARQVAAGKRKRVTIQEKSVQDYLGIIRYHHGMAGKHDEIGVATGLAWTAVGGDVLAVETSLMKGKGNLQLTGHLGEVMQESAKAAVSYARSQADVFGIQSEIFSETDIHIHVPEGQTPKDGPSAGITLATSLISALTKRPIRRTVAMTGEITLRGNVLPVGGIKEKMLGAHRAGITDIVLPVENKKDLEELPEHVKKALNFHFVERMSQVLEIALAN